MCMDDHIVSLGNNLLCQIFIQSMKSYHHLLIIIVVITQSVRNKY